MSRDAAFQRAMELSIKYETDAVVYRSDMSDYGAMLLEVYDGRNFDIVSVFEKGIRIDP